MANRKELKEAYKQMEIPMGVFQIKNEQNGKMFIDYSTDIQAKWNRHKTELKFGSHRTHSLQEDWKKYGAEAFTFKILSELKANDEDNPDYNKELQLLKEMVITEKDISEQHLYR